jgi:hypothetical protein
MSDSASKYLKNLNQDQSYVNLLKFYHVIQFILILQFGSTQRQN